MTDKEWEGIVHFKKKEFKHPEMMKLSLLKVLDDIRERCGHPMPINSDGRTEEENKKEKGTPNSAHLRGLAVDIGCMGSRDRFDIIRAAIEAGVLRIGIAKTFVHLDIDDSMPPRVCWLYPSVK